MFEAQLETQKPLRLNFNERSDYNNSLEKQFSFTDELWRYPDRQPLEYRLAEIYNLDPSQVICTNGGDEGIMILMRLINESSRLILPLPAFSQYLWGVESWKLDADLIEPNADLTIDIEKTLSTIEGNKQSVTVITRPNNPTGELVDLQDLTTILQTAKANNGWVFVDEAYIEFSDEPSVCDTLLEQFENLVVLRTLSKAYGLAGIRLGYLLGSVSIISEFKLRCAPFNIATPTLEIAAKALETENQIEAQKYCSKIKVNRNKLYQWLTDNKLNVLNSQANFLVLRLPKFQAKAVASFFERNQILVRNFDDELMQDCLRITIPFDTTKLIQLLTQALLPELLCFDMDGVLIDTSGSYDASVIETVKQLSNQTINVDNIEQLKAAGGYNNDWVVTQKLLQNIGVELELDEVIAAFQKIYLGENNDGLVTNETLLINPSLVNTINQLNISDDKVRAAIVTGRPLKEAKAGRLLTGLTELDIISLDCVKEAKPSPEGIQFLQQKFSTLSWMCGDNPDDMQAAVASNSVAIGIATSSSSISTSKEQALYAAGADVVITNINELENWLCPLL